MAKGAQIRYKLEKLNNDGSALHYVGEVNQQQEPIGKGIRVKENGRIYLANQKKGEISDGNYLEIQPDGTFDVGYKYYDVT